MKDGSEEKMMPLFWLQFGCMQIVMYVWFLEIYAILSENVILYYKEASIIQRKLDLCIMLLIAHTKLRMKLCARFDRKRDKQYQIL